jgi:hypothetical protein
MPEAAFNFIASREIDDREAALARVWSVDHWAKTLGRVRSIRVREETEDQQIFELEFDAGNATVDKVTVRRVRAGQSIWVEHIVPPPGIVALKARWWVESEGPPRLYVRRKITMSQAAATPKKLRNIYRILGETLTDLLAAPLSEEVSAPPVPQPDAPRILDAVK